MHKKNRVMKCVQPVINYIHDLQWRFESDNTVPFAALRKEIRDLIKELENCLSENLILESKIEIVKYVVVVLIDDVINYSNWAFNEEWIYNPLEDEIFQTNYAKEKFFKYLRDEGEKDPDLAELFYVSLLFGFNRNEEDVRDYQFRLYHIMYHDLTDDDRFLSPGANEYIEGKTKILPPLFGFWTLMVILAVSTGLYFIISQVLWHNAVDLIQDTAQFIKKIGI